MKPVIIALVGSLSQATVTRLEGEGYEVVQEKMSGAVRVENKSLRDYFAAAALQGMIASSPIVDRTDPEKINKKGWAAQAYGFADAMLAEREKGGD